VINIAQGGVSGISPTVLSATILIAASSNNIAKAIYALSFGGFKFSRRSALMLFVLAMLGFAAAAIYILSTAPVQKSRATNTERGQKTIERLLLEGEHLT